MPSLPLAPDLDAEAVEVDVLALLRLARAAAVQTQPQVAPEAGPLAGHVVAGPVHVRLQQPPPAAPLVLAAVGGFLLPAFQNAREVLDRRLPALLFRDVDAQLVRLRLQ